MEGQPIRKIVDEELEKLEPHLTTEEYDKLVEQGLYRTVLTDLIQSDVEGLINPLESMGVDVRQNLTQALGVIREVKTENADDAREVISASLKRILG